MGGRKQKKKINLDWSTKETSVYSNHSAPARNLRKADLGAVIFGATNYTINECLSRQLFGLPEGHYSYIKNIKQGLVLFLFNYSDRKLHGVFEAAGPGQLNIDRYAWVADGDDTGYTRYPAQVKICVRQLCCPLSEEQWQPIIASNYYESNHFYFELDHDQTSKLLSLFSSSPMNSSISTKWKNLYASLPAASKRKEYHAPLPEKVNQTTKVSYTSTLGGTNAPTTTASTSLPFGKWSALFKSETVNDDKSGNENTTRHEQPFNQECEYKGDFSQADTWEGSHWDAVFTTEAEDDQTWESSHWASELVEGRQQIDPITCGVEHDKTVNQTTKVSYASTLGGTNTPTTTASTSLPSGKWSALFKSETVNDDKCGNENTTRDEQPFNQEYEYKDDFSQADTWEGSHWDAVCTVEAEDDQTWEESHWASELVEDMQQIDPTTCGVEHDKTEDVSAQHLARSSSSPQPLDGNPDSNPSLSVKTVESDIEENHEKDIVEVPNTVVETSTDLQSLVAKLMQEFQVMKGSELKQIVKINRLEQELDTSKQEIQQLRNRVSILESGSRSIVDPAEVDNQPPSKFLEKFTDSVLIVGGFDGSTWLPALDSYIPSQDIKSSLSPMNFIKKYASAATLNGELYHFGGDGSHTVESFNPRNNQWSPRPQLLWKNINVAGASVKDRIFVVGGAIGSNYSSEVEYLDMNIGRWLPAPSMQSKRLAPAAVELDNILYVSGGYDGLLYSSSVERFDPREEIWCKIPNMNARKGFHSMVVLNGKLYTIGGFSGGQYLATAEYLDTRMGAWVEAEPMNVSRGNFGAFVMGGKIYTIGGRKEKNEILDIVECYEEGSRWEIATNMKAIGKKSHFSAFVM